MGRTTVLVVLSPGVSDSGKLSKQVKGEDVHSEERATVSSAEYNFIEQTG